MNRRVFIRNSAGCVALLGCGSVFPACSGSEREYYSPEDFAAAPKIDAHFHYDFLHDALLKYTPSIHMHLLAINVDAGVPLDLQLQIGEAMKKQHPGAFDFLGTFDPATFGSDTFAGDAVRRIGQCMAAGARGIKIWKNIGMELRDADGRYVMVDDPAFAPVFAFLEKEGITLAAHLGEPRNCWLPFEEITMQNDLNYYRNHPEYHMYRHPEAPTYEQQIEARDHILERYPGLTFVGAHIGSMEWSLDEVAHRFDRYPNFFVDLAARIGHVQLHTLRNREKVRDFFIRYQDRILFGTDWSFEEPHVDGIEQRCRNLYDGWQTLWRFFATGETLPAETINMPDAPETIEGLRLPRKVVDKLFHGNACRAYSIS
jgi:predicted TIM-barrel fold metal-dependent hydrolase